ENTKNVKPIQVEVEGNNSGLLEYINKNNPSWNEQVAQETKELKKITNTYKKELKENRTYVTKEKISLVKKSDKIATLIEQDNNTFTYNEEVIEVNTLNEEVLKINICNKNNNKTTICNKEVSETSTGNKDNIETTTQNKSEQEFHANKEENPYLQDDIPITDSVGLQENDLTQNKQNRPLLPLIEIDNNKKNKETLH
ncbi:23365_t:CDS:2, partial [Cetraspora pellucida]